MQNETKLYKIKSQLVSLTPGEKKELISFLRSSYSVFEDYTEVAFCPHCKSTKIVKNGTRNGHHKYICRNQYCKKNFTYRTKTILSHIQKLNQWNMFLEDFMSLNITPVRQLKQRIGVSEQTIFNWRHKLLSVLAKKDCAFADEIVEFDEANFLISRKGRQQMNIPDISAYRHWRKNQPGESDYKVKMFIAYGRSSGQMEL